MGKSVLILGVTGSIASGKSLVADLLRQRGATLLSADQLAREVVAAGSVLLGQLVDLFGPYILNGDGSLDRDALGAVIFADAAARSRLNHLVHPAIGALAERRLSLLAQSTAPLVVYEAPLLFEAGAEKRVDTVLVVTLDSEIQLQRLMARDLLDESAARQRIEAQMSQDEKAARADYLIDNSGSLHDLEQKVEELWRELCG